jgi:hypothetical protein
VIEAFALIAALVAFVVACGAIVFDKTDGEE